MKLLREGREELYNRLQQAFNEINEKIELERKEATLEATRNFTILKDHLKNTIDTVLNSEDYRLSKELLREEQTTWREAKLFREHRDALYSSIQDAYTILTIRQEEDQKKSGQQADIAFAELKPKALELLRLANISVEFRTLRDQLKDIQARIREATLRKEHREELNPLLQEAFEIINLRQDEERESFEKEAQKNYLHLKTLVNKALIQAEETHEYKETREFLKKIQTEFKGIKMIREQREELYSRLQTAFDILNKRLDEFFRTKKKNWEVKMQYKLSESSSEIFLLRENIKNKTVYLKELEDQLDIIVSAGKDNQAILGLQSRISSVRMDIRKTETQAEELELQMRELKNRLDPEEPV